MDTFERDQSIKNHNEIIQMIDEIREFEDLDINLETDENKKNNEIIEIENKTIDYDSNLLDEENKNKFFDKLKNVHFTSHPNEKDQIEKFVIPNTFNIGFNKTGELVNLDLKKKKNIEKKKHSFSIKNLIKRDKKRENNEESDEDDTSKIGKLKAKLNFLSKIKKVLPGKK